MKAVKYGSDGLYLDRNAPIPEFEHDHSVIIRVKAVGICGTDFDIKKGEFPVVDGVILGHEISGAVHKIASGVTDFKQGQRVAINGTRGCTNCYFCNVNKSMFCSKGGASKYYGVVRNGGFAEYMVVDDADLCAIPDDLSFQKASMSEPMSSLLHILDVAPIDDKEQSKVLIIGGGIAGLNILNYLNFIGVKNITLIQRSAHRRKLIADMKFKNVTVVSDTDLHSEYLQNSGNPGWGFDNVIDCSGNTEAIANGIKYLRPAGKLALYGLPSKDVSINMNIYDLMVLEKCITGALYQVNNFKEGVDVLIELSRAGRLDFDNYGVKDYTLDDYEKAFNDLTDRKIIKAFILPST